MTTKKYLIGIDFSDNSEPTVIECDPKDLMSRVDDWILEQYRERRDVEVYELGRKGIMPKVEIQFV